MEETRPQEENVSDVIRELMERSDDTYLRAALLDLHAADIAEAMEHLDSEKALMLFPFLETEKAAEVLVELDTPILQDVLSGMSDRNIVDVIGAMDSDDATDVIGELEEEVAVRVLNALPWEDFREVKTLLRHDEETAGGIMALEIVAVNQDRSAAEALDVLRKKAEDVEDVYNIYVVDGQGVLKGFASLKDVITSPSEARLSEFMDREVVSIPPELDQEEVANLFQKYNLVAAPVVDTEGRLVGRITVDDILEVVEEEASEDITKMAGITHEEFHERSILKISSVRLPWLLVAFAGQMISAKVLNHFVPMAHGMVMATLFIPLIMAMAGNIGIQSSTVIIRGLALGDIRLKDTGRRLLQEISVAFLNGLLIAALLFGVVALWLHKPLFGAVLGIALLAVLFMAGAIGTLVPFFLKRFNIDPAIATGPFITTSNDVLGLIIYYSIISAIGGM